MTKTKQAQIKINLPLQLKEYVDKQAYQYGFTSTNYIKHLILKDAQSAHPSPYTPHTSNHQDQRIVNDMYMKWVKDLEVISKPFLDMFSPLRPARQSLQKHILQRFRDRF